MPENRKKLKIGLALGSGAARGLAHIGVIRALKEKGIAVDMIAGSSIGALVGACYAKEASITDLEEVVLKTDWKQLARLLDPNLTILFKGIIHGKKIKELLATIIGDIDFKDLKIPLAVVACDVDTGEEVVIKEGSVIEAVRASISIPAIFMPEKLKGRFLIDGGMVNPIPISAAKAMGAEFIIASNVNYKPERRSLFGSGKKLSLSVPRFSKNKTLAALNNEINKLIQENKDKFKNFQKFAHVFKLKPDGKSERIDPATPSIFDAVIQAMYIMEYEIAKVKLKEADLVISADIGHIAALEFYRGREAISEGYKAAKEALSKHIINTNGHELHTN
jgi:NTE family protein